MEIKKYLSLEVIWKDDEMFELEIKVSNGRYAGITEVYEQREPLLKFVTQLLEYPLKDTKVHSCGKKGSYAYFEMRFYPIGVTKIGVLILLEENVSTDFREEEKDMVSLELLIEQSALDKFQKELQSLAHYEKGKALLLGI